MTYSQNKNTTAFILGFTAIIFWSTGALFICFLKAIPTLQIQSFSLLTGGLISVLLEKEKASWSTIKNRIIYGWPFLLALSLNSFGYTYAFQHAPAAQVEILYFSWPALIILLRNKINQTRLRRIDIIGVIVGFAAVCFVMAPELADSEISLKHALGYSAALVASASWVFYVIARDHLDHKKTRYKTIGQDLLILGLVNSCILFFTNQAVTPSQFELGVLATYMILVYALAFPIWEKSVNLNYKLVSILSYSIPLLSLLWLILGGFAKLTWQLAVASIMIVLSCFCIQQVKKTSLTNTDYN